ncbi:MAG TPA: DUF3667 domain-containing protein [Roseivirga sp.]
MIEKKRRSTSCSNCSSQLEESYNYCPVCGQSNTDNNITFTTLVREFIDNYLGIDSKLAHSLVPFLIKPGSLTNRFQEGRIKHFIHPIRLYFVMSLFYFFTISYLLSDFSMKNLSDETNLTSATLDAFRDNKRLMAIPDSVKLSLLEDSLVQKYSDINSFSQLLDSLDTEYGDEWLEDMKVSLTSVPLPPSEDEIWVEKMHRFARDTRMADTVFWDSLNNGKNRIGGNFLSPSQKNHLYAQTRKIFANEEGFKGFVLGNLPLMMFILIPLFAGVLKFVYVRRKHLYIKHIVHALHIHSFAYLMYGLGLLIMFKIIGASTFPNADLEEVRAIIGFIFFVGASTYAYISFLKVYKQGWFKTLIKFNIVGFVYAFFLQIFFYLEVFISFWYY